MVFIQGLFNQTAHVSTSPHLGRMNVLSGATVSLDPKEIRVGTSMDQVLASQIGSRTAIPSLVLGIEPNELRLEDGLSMIYGSSLSWISPTKPATKEIYRREPSIGWWGTAPRAGSIAASWTKSGRIRRACARGSARRQRQADRVLRIDPRHREADRAASKEERIEGWRPTLSKPDMPRPANELPQNVPDHMKLMLDLIVLAFQMDKTPSRR